MARERIYRDNREIAISSLLRNVRTAFPIRLAINDAGDGDGGEGGVEGGGSARGRITLT